MARIRYIGEQLIARAFERTFHRNHWDGEHGLDDHQIAVLSTNPQFDVEAADTAPVPDDATSGVGSGEDVGSRNGNGQ